MSPRSAPPNAIHCCGEGTSLREDLSSRPVREAEAVTQKRYPRNEFLSDPPRRDRARRSRTSALSGRAPLDQVRGPRPKRLAGAECPCQPANASAPLLRAIVENAPVLLLDKTTSAARRPHRRRGFYSDLTQGTGLYAWFAALQFSRRYGQDGKAASTIVALERAWVSRKGLRRSAIRGLPYAAPDHNQGACKL